MKTVLKHKPLNIYAPPFEYKCPKINENIVQFDMAAILTYDAIA